MSIAQNLQAIKSKLPAHVKLVAVSKFKPAADIMEAYNAGHTVFGENRVQEMVDKQQQLPADIEWHMIGHLQTNKVKYMAGFVHLIHGVDSFKLLQEIDKQAEKAGRVQNCLLQMHIAQEETKFGFSREEVLSMLAGDDFAALQNISVCGLMGMASLTEDSGQVRNEFKSLRLFFDELKAGYFSNQGNFKEMSMGMSGDYKIAIDEGSTIIRVGSSIFGGR
jgi:PLP dependent protein